MVVFTNNEQMEKTVFEVILKFWQSIDKMALHYEIWALLVQAQSNFEFAYENICCNQILKSYTMPYSHMFILSMVT